MASKQTAYVDRNTHWEIEQFLYKEAEYLDDRRLDDWLELLDEEIDYKIPVRVSQEGRTSDFLDTYHMYETYETLSDRITRRAGEYAWSERPPSRTRHFVSNVRVEPGDGEDEYEVNSNLLLYVSKGDSGDYDTLSAKREDVIVNTDDGWKIRKRTAYLDITTIPLDAMNYFL
ncbi:aromatic-ring-hydroxylating dioxygenase subunit beta [Haloarchaeobius salinus]|uniref:aromatic-ring-hydroxylating dioxygenase subunit beta n=1 Tax=Haloarchaeobius salinus TaxID=1198298 RepID=UPI00210B8F92|nr:aromatic-ring-hydroxylating dioxygenase subunit beta [Haloarchaeobius salinus]